MERRGGGLHRPKQWLATGLVLFLTGIALLTMAASFVVAPEGEPITAPASPVVPPDDETSPRLTPAPVPTLGGLPTAGPQPSRPVRQSPPPEPPRTEPPRTQPPTSGHEIAPPGAATPPGAPQTLTMTATPAPAMTSSPEATTIAKSPPAAATTAPTTQATTTTTTAAPTTAETASTTATAIPKTTTMSPPQPVAPLGTGVAPAIPERRHSNWNPRQPWTPPLAQAPPQTAPAPFESMSAIITAVTGFISAIAGLIVAFTGMVALRRRGDGSVPSSGPQGSQRAGRMSTDPTIPETPIRSPEPADSLPPTE